MTSDQRLVKIKGFEDLEVWKEAHKLTIKIYEATRKFPKDELYGLISQLRRSASSVSANIVEGHSRDTTKEFIKFLYNARASAAETEYHLILSRDLGYLNIEEFGELRSRYIVLGKRINALIGSLKKKSIY